MIDFKGSHFEHATILWGVRWYLAYPISYRHLEEMMHERGVAVDHSTLNRWVVKFAPELEKAFRRRQRSVRRPTPRQTAKPVNTVSPPLDGPIARSTSAIETPARA